MKLEDIFALICSVTGEMSLALVRRRLRAGARSQWAVRLRSAADALDAE